MNIEEAIDILTQKEIIDLSNHFNNTRFFEAIYIVLTAYEKQSKEIEELKEKNEYLPNWVIKKYVSKDKIKAKIEEFKTVRDTILENEKELNRPMMTYDLKRNDYCEKMLQSLLEKE